MQPRFRYLQPADWLAWCRGDPGCDAQQEGLVFAYDDDDDGVA